MLDRADAGNRLAEPGLPGLQRLGTGSPVAPIPAVANIIRTAC
ncbi:MAG: hypothetical protein U1E38_07850 [Rhodospirillales bacterium]